MGIASGGLWEAVGLSPEHGPDIVPVGIVSIPGHSKVCSEALLMF